MAKISRNILLKVLALLLCFFIASAPFFQPKKVNADVLGKFKSFVGIVSTVIYGLQSVGYISKTTLTPENLDNVYNKADEYLHKNFGTALEYAEALRQVDQLGMDIASGAVFLPGKYSGKLWYSFVDAVKDVLWPNSNNDQIEPSIDADQLISYIGQVNGIHYYYGAPKSNDKFTNNIYPYFVSALKSRNFQNDPTYESKYATNLNLPKSMEYLYAYNNYTGWNMFVLKDGFIDERAIGSFTFNTDTVRNGTYGVIRTDKSQFYPEMLNFLFGNMTFVDVKTATANKITVPKRLPQTIINNINNYDGTQNLVIAPTDEEMKDVPTEDITPDHPGTTDPDPTPTPEPTPPQHNGDKWVNPIGDFMDGLLKFMQAAFVPTLTLNLDALNSVPTNLGEKFPFSLPGDLVRLFTVFQADPVPLILDWEFDFTNFGIGKIPLNVDLRMFDPYAPMLRTFVFLSFLIGLAWKTFDMFFGGADE